MEIVREVVRVNDKSAVDEYSEMSFTSFEEKSGFSSKTRSTTYVGVRIIKPDKSVKEVSTDEMILTLDESREKQVKLAISDLQPGDVIDYFIATEHKMKDDYDAKVYNLVLADESPVLHYSFHGQLGQNYSIDYRTYNGAPDLVMSTNGDKELIIDFEKKDMPPSDLSLWVAPARQFPLIRLSISLGIRQLSGYTRRSRINQPGEVNKNPDVNSVVQNLAYDLAEASYAMVMGKEGRKEIEEVLNTARKKAKAAGLDYESMSDEEKAAFLFYIARFKKVLSFRINDIKRSVNIGNYMFSGYAVYFNSLFRMADMGTGILLSTPRMGYRINEVLHVDDLESAVYLNQTKKIIHFENAFDFPFSIPSAFDGVSETRSVALKIQSDADLSKNYYRSAYAGPGFALPASNAATNTHLEELAISLNPGDTRIAVKRKATIAGLFRADFQRQLILYEDYYEQERKLLGEERGLLEMLAEDKKGRGYVIEVKNAFEEARRKQKENAIREAKDWFEQEVTDLTDFKVEKMGVRHTDPNFVFSEKFALDGLIKRAGNNIILEIGKIQGRPLSIKEHQRKRNVDVYMPFPRAIGYDIRIRIPDGYTVAGVESLNKSVQNETGYFKTEARVDGQVITVTIKKGYFHNFEPASNWDKMLAFMDASNEWESAKLLFKKN
ncbi:MAG: DUF3857 domain-containing protein [Chitinophagaceae bacterium]|nr:DUF3857 domain-containing protein [Chitinophagaceae bacterium]